MRVFVLPKEQQIPRRSEGSRASNGEGTLKWQQSGRNNGRNKPAETKDVPRTARTDRGEKPTVSSGLEPVNDTVKYDPIPEHVSVPASGLKVVKYVNGNYRERDIMDVFRNFLERSPSGSLMTLFCVPTYHLILL